MDQEGRYTTLWQLYSGEWRRNNQLRSLRTRDRRLYEATRQLTNHIQPVAKLYEQLVYVGDLPTDGKALPDGTRGAIPIDPQTGSESADEALIRAVAELWQLWNWRMFKGYRPKLASVLGDCLTELTDDVARGKVLPTTVWPGYVVDLELDAVGNVKRYALEWRVTVEQSTAFGQTVKGESYTFRKEVDGDAFRYYRDGKPFAYPDIGDAVIPNPYGFVPAVWDRFDIVPGDRGLGAFDAALQMVQEINSDLSHAWDYQRKAFSAPVVVKGQIVMPARQRGSSTLSLSPERTDDPDADAASVAQKLGLLNVRADAGAGVEHIQTDLGQTLAMLQFQQDQILTVLPEAKAWQEIRQMTDITGPAVERAIGDIAGRIRMARANLDPNTVKIFQMAIAIYGFRLQSNAYPPAVLTTRHEAFRPFGLESFKAGLLDMTIPDRPVLESTNLERLQELVLIESLSTEWAMEKAGVPPEVVAQIVADRQAQAAMIAGVTSDGGDEEAA